MRTKSEEDIDRVLDVVAELRKNGREEILKRFIEMHRTNQQSVVRNCIMLAIEFGDIVQDQTSKFFDQRNEGILAVVRMIKREFDSGGIYLPHI